MYGSEKVNICRQEESIMNNCYKKWRMFFFFVYDQMITVVKAKHLFYHKQYYSRTLQSNKD